MYLFWLQAEVALQVGADLGEQFVTVQVLVGIDHPYADAHLVTVVRQVGFYQLAAQVIRNKTGQQHQLHIAERAAVELFRYFVGGSDGEHLAGFRQGFQVVLNVHQLAQPGWGEPVGPLERVGFGFFRGGEGVCTGLAGKGVTVGKRIGAVCSGSVAVGKGIRVASLVSAVRGKRVAGAVVHAVAIPAGGGLVEGSFLRGCGLGRIDDDIQRGGAAQFAVDLQHALIDFRVFLEVINKAIFHGQPADAPQGRDDHGQRDDQQNGAAALGKAGKGQGQLPAEITPLPGFAGG